MADEASVLNARISKLDFHEGDVLVVLVPQVLTPEGRLLFAQVMRAGTPPGVKCLILDGGTTIEKLKREHEAEVDSAAYRAAFGGLRMPKDESNTPRAWMQRLKDFGRWWWNA